MYACKHKMYLRTVEMPFLINFIVKKLMDLM